MLFLENKLQMLKYARRPTPKRDDRKFKKNFTIRDVNKFNPEIKRGTLRGRKIRSYQLIGTSQNNLHSSGWLLNFPS